MRNLVILIIGFVLLSGCAGDTVEREEIKDSVDELVVVEESQDVVEDQIVVERITVDGIELEISRNKDSDSFIIEINEDQFSKLGDFEILSLGEELSAWCVIPKSIAPDKYAIIIDLKGVTDSNGILNWDYLKGSSAIDDSKFEPYSDELYEIYKNLDKQELYELAKEIEEIFRKLKCID